MNCNDRITDQHRIKHLGEVSLQELVADHLSYIKWC